MSQLLTRFPLPLAPQSVNLTRCGLIIVDEVNGFASVGAGALAPPVPCPMIARMVAQTDWLARSLISAGRPVLALLDSHPPGQPEPPYPPHCEQGSGEDELVPCLKWLEQSPAVTLLRKDCINGFVGGIDRLSGQNLMTNWIAGHQLQTLLVVGICTDICVMDLVLTLLSARNHGLLPGLQDIVVYEPGCATYHLPMEVVQALGLPETAVHPQADTHHMGLYFMASRGAKLASALEWQHG